MIPTNNSTVSEGIWTNGNTPLCTQDGVDYWLVKNSWGFWWGDQGYIKIQRGVNMCGIGSTQTILSCEQGIVGDILVKFPYLHQPPMLILSF